MARVMERRRLTRGHRLRPTLGGVFAAASWICRDCHEVASAAEWERREHELCPKAPTAGDDG